MEVLGQPAQQLDWRSFQKIGYVSENQKLPEEMSLRELLAYLKPYYPGWDVALCEELLQQVDLPAERKLKNLSRGMKMKAALLIYEVTAGPAFQSEVTVPHYTMKPGEK